MQVLTVTPECWMDLVQGFAVKLNDWTETAVIASSRHPSLLPDRSPPISDGLTGYLT